MKQALILCCLLSIPACLASAAPTSIKTPPASLKGARFVVPGGLRVLVRSERTTGVVGISLLVRTSIAEEPHPGIGFLLSRLLLQKTLGPEPQVLQAPRTPPGDRIEIQWQGDCLSLSGTVLPCETARFLSRLSEAVRRPRFTLEEVELARTRLLAQIEQHDLDPYGLASDALRQVLFRQTPYGRARLEGSPQSLKAITPQEVSDFCRRIFVGSRMVLSIAGDILPDAALTASRSAFEGLSRGVPPDPVPALSPPAGERLFLVQGSWSLSSMPFSYIAAGFLRPKGGAEEFAVERVLESLLVGPSGRLHRLTGQPGIAAGPGGEGSFGALSPLWVEQSPFFLYGLIQPYILDSRTGEVRLALEDVRSRWLHLLRSIVSQGFTPEEVARARRQSLGQYALRRERMRDRAWWLAFWEMSGPGFAEDAKVIPGIAKVTPESIARYVRRWMASPQVALVLPSVN